MSPWEGFAVLRPVLAALAVARCRVARVARWSIFVLRARRGFTIPPAQVEHYAIDCFAATLTLAATDGYRETLTAAEGATRLVALADAVGLRAAQLARLHEHLAARLPSPMPDATPLAQDATPRSSTTAMHPSAVPPDGICGVVFTSAPTTLLVTRQDGSAVQLQGPDLLDSLAALVRRTSAFACQAAADAALLRALAAESAASPEGTGSVALAPLFAVPPGANASAGPLAPAVAPVATREHPSAVALPRAAATPSVPAEAPQTPAAPPAPPPGDALSPEVETPDGPPEAGARVRRLASVAALRQARVRALLADTQAHAAAPPAS